MDGRRRVVVVEDDKDIRELLVEVLGELGFDAAGYPDGAAALEALRRPGIDPTAVILLDLEMPRMSGWEFRREQLRDPRLASIPVVVASAAEAAAVHADAYLPKPYETAELCGLLARLAFRGAAGVAASAGSH